MWMILNSDSNYRVFYPLPWNHASDLGELKTHDHWKEFFDGSATVHFYASSNPSRKILRPNHYGKNVPAYLSLAIQHCPLSYYSEKMF